MWFDHFSFAHFYLVCYASILKYSTIQLQWLLLLKAQLSTTKVPFGLSLTEGEGSRAGRRAWYFVTLLTVADSLSHGHICLSHGDMCPVNEGNTCVTASGIQSPGADPTSSSSTPNGGKTPPVFSIGGTNHPLRSHPHRKKGVIVERGDLGNGRLGSSSPSRWAP